jgi:hypothetical protein
MPDSLVGERPSLDSAWRARLLQRATRLLLERRCSFDVLVSHMAGADPMVVRSLLMELAHTGSTRLRSRVAATISDCERSTPEVAVASDPQLPMPHPLDYEWRFTPSTRQDLARWAMASAPQSILLLGCPTVALVLLLQRCAAHVTLIDDNPALPLLNELVGHRHVGYEQLRADLVSRPDVTAGINADVVIADAPFYPEAMAAFLRSGIVGARMRARLMFALPPFGSRPTAEHDVRTFYRRAAAFGLHHVTTNTGSARYLTPSFEEKALKAAGLPAVANDWRAADLAVFRRGQPTRIRMRTAASERSEWHEIIASGKRWRVKINDSTSGAVEGLFPSVGIGSTLDTVSRRDSRRLDANICTEDNEFYVTANPSLFLRILDSVAIGLDPVITVEQSVGRELSPAEHNEISLVLSLISRASASVNSG